MSTKPRTTAIYARISRDTEGTEIGVENQIATCRALAAALGLVVVDVFTDNDRGASSLTKKPRPGFNALREAAERGDFTTILAYSMSRLTRRPAEWETLIALGQSHGIEYIYKVSPKYDLNTADGRATARTVAAWDAAEAERTGERVRHAKEAQLHRGEDIGGPRPFGWEAGRREHRPAEADLIRSGADAILSGASVRSVAALWNASGITPPRAGRPSRNDGTASATWRPQTVRSILANPRQTGRIIVRGVDYGIVAPPILTEDQHRALVALFADPARKPKRGAIPATSAALGWVTCGVCGGTLYLAGNKQGWVVRCSRAPYVRKEFPGAHVSITVAGIDAMLRDVTLAHLLSSVDRGTAREGASTVAGVTAARLALTELERVRDSWQEQATWAGADKSLIQRKLAEVGASIAERTAELDALLTAGVTSQAVTIAREFVRELSPGGSNAVYGASARPVWLAYWEGLSVPVRREIARGVLGEVALVKRDRTRLHRLRVRGVEPSTFGPSEWTGEVW